MARTRLAFLIAFVVLLASGCPDPGTPTALPRLFEAQVLYPAGTAPAGILIADFNGDARPDVAVGNRGSGDVSIALGQEDDTLGTAAAYAAAPGITALYLAEMTGGAPADLITVNSATSSITVLPGAGSGTFGAARTTALPAGANPLAAAAGEVTGDGIPDLVVATSALNGATLLRGRGDGTFTNAGIVATGGGARHVVLLDRDDDGDLDLYTVSVNSNVLTLHTNNGSGDFTLQSTTEVGGNPRDFVLADFNGDGLRDAVVSNPGSGDFSFVPGTGAGFGTERRIPFDGRATRIIARDFNKDARLDFAAIRFREAGDAYALGQVAVFLGNGNGTFKEARYFGAREQSLNLDAADLNGDGQLDIVTANPETADFSVLYGRGDGSFETDERFPVGAQPRFVIAADFNRDNKRDLAVGSLGANDVSVLLGRGDGTFAPRISTAIGEDARALAAGLINNDPNPDLVVAGIDSNTAIVLLGRGDGGFQAPKAFSLKIAGDRDLDVRAVQLGDVDKDGFLDIVSANSEADTVSVLYGDGAGEFSAAVQFFVSNFPNDLELADLDGDGWLDVVVTNAIDPTPGVGEPRLNIVYGDGLGGFGGDRQAYANEGIPRDLALADLDNDGDRDAVTSDTAAKATRVSLLAGRPGGKLSANTRLNAGDLPQTVAVGDINGDGLRDILTTNATESVSVLLNRGGLSFAAPQNYYFGRDPIAGILTDLNGDGKLDFAAVNEFTAELSVLLGR